MRARIALQFNLRLSVLCTDSMESEGLVEEIRNSRVGASADNLVRAEAVHFISGEPQFAVGRHHIGVNLQRGFAVFGEMMLAVDLNDDPLPVRSNRKSMRCRGRGRR